MVGEGPTALVDQAMVTGTQGSDLVEIGETAGLPFAVGVVAVAIGRGHIAVTEDAGAFRSTVSWDTRTPVRMRVAPA